MPPIPERGPSTRAQELAELPRIGTSPVASQRRLVRMVESLALALGEEVTRRTEIADPHWWQTQDLLDTALDVLDAVRKIPEDMLFAPAVEGVGHNADQLGLPPARVEVPSFSLPGAA